MFDDTKSALKRLKITDADLTEMLKAQPSLRSALLGHTARFQLKKLLTPLVTRITQQDDHDRSRRGTITVLYKNVEIAIRCCSIQTKSIRKIDNITHASFQCDASDRRPIKIGRHSVTTTCSKADNFDIVAVALFALEYRWEYIFALSRDLKRTSDKKFPPQIQDKLLATNQNITIPLQDPYTSDIKKLLNAVSASKHKKMIPGKKSRLNRKGH